MTDSGNNLLSIWDLINDIAIRFENSNIYYGHGTDNAFDEAVYLVLAALDLPFDLSDEELDQAIAAEDQSRINTLARERITARKPVAYLVNRAWFAGLPFFVDETVLIPRSPLAELIEEGFSPWLEGKPVNTILDIGTGSGCIAIASAHVFPGATVDAIDISAEALEVARKNIAAYGLEDRVHLVLSDLYAGLTDRKYDLIIANPPYVDEEDMDSLPLEFRHEPQSGLAAGADGLDIVRRIISESAGYLNPGGTLVVEVGNSQAAMEAVFPDLPLTWLEFERGGEGVFLLPADALNI